MGHSGERKRLEIESLLPMSILLSHLRTFPDTHDGSRFVRSPKLHGEYSCDTVRIKCTFRPSNIPFINPSDYFCIFESRFCDSSNSGARDDEVHRDRTLRRAAVNIGLART